MSDNVSQGDGLGDTQSGPAPDSQTTIAEANASQQFGNGKLLGDRSARDVSRPKNFVLKTGSSTKDQSRSQP